MTRKKMSDLARQKLGMDASITRRDFINGTLVGCGAALSTAPGATLLADGIMSQRLDLSPSGSPWTGYGGIGDYRWSNGNTQAVYDAAHAIRDNKHDDPYASIDIDESYDMVVVGGGFSGISAAYEFHKSAGKGQSCLLLENHPMPGGEAKLNQFEVDGHLLVAPQGSNEAAIPDERFAQGRYAVFTQYWDELGMPRHFDLEPLAGGAEGYHISNGHYTPMLLEDRYDVGYFFGSQGWRRNPLAEAFSNTPWPAAFQNELDDFVNNRRDVISGVTEDPDRWLDSMTYRELLDRLEYSSEISRYIDPLIAVGNFGVAGDAISAFAARRLTLPGTIPADSSNRFSDVEIVSFPGGNAALLRTMLKRILPMAISGGDDFAAIQSGKVRFDELDKPKNRIRIRLSSTAVRVEHDGKASKSDSVIVTYTKNGKIHRVRAKAVVMASGGWVNRRVVRDLPEVHQAAYARFAHGPVLTANVAVRHWRFMDNLGITVARWFEGLGWFTNVMHNMALGERQHRLTPDTPTVFTLYIPFLNPGYEAAVQGQLGRAQLLGKSYADFELEIREQFTLMFGAHGFDARRDIAGIVLNRWGHAFLAPSPGMFFGTHAYASPLDTVRQPFGRIVFAHSELQGNMNMAHAMLEGRRGAHEALSIM